MPSPTLAQQVERLISGMMVDLCILEGAQPRIIAGYLQDKLLTLATTCRAEGFNEGVEAAAKKICQHTIRKNFDRCCDFASRIRSLTRTAG